MFSISNLNSLSFISWYIFVCDNKHPYIANAVWSGLRHVHTFIFSTLSTVALSVNLTPTSSSFGLPLGNASSITKYSDSSAFVNKAA